MSPLTVLIIVANAFFAGEKFQTGDLLWAWINSAVTAVLFVGSYFLEYLPRRSRA